MQVLCSTANLSSRRDSIICIRNADLLHLTSFIYERLAFDLSICNECLYVHPVVKPPDKIWAVSCIQSHKTVGGILLTLNPTLYILENMRSTVIVISGVKLTFIMGVGLLC